MAAAKADHHPLLSCSEDQERPERISFFECLLSPVDPVAYAFQLEGGGREGDRIDPMVVALLLLASAVGHHSHQYASKSFAGVRRDVPLVRTRRGDTPQHTTGHYETYGQRSSDACGNRTCGAGPDLRTGIESFHRKGRAYLY